MCELHCQERIEIMYESTYKSLYFIYASQNSEDQLFIATYILTHSKQLCDAKFFFYTPFFLYPLFGLHATVSEKNWHPHWWTTEVTYWSNRGLKINYGASWYFTTPFLRHCPLLGSFLSYQGGGTFFFYVPLADETWPLVIKIQN